MDIVYVGLCLVLAGLQVSDALTTLYILKHGGRELNPVINWLFKVFDSPSRAFVFKGILAVVIGACLGTVSINALAGVVVFYILVTAWNVFQIYKD